MAITEIFFSSLGTWRVFDDAADDFYVTFPNRAEWVESGDGSDHLIGTVTRIGNAEQGDERGLTKPNPLRTLPDTLDGGAGDDTILLDDFRGLIIGGTGNDQISSNSQRQTPDETILILGDTDSNDTRGHGNDTMEGNSGDDIFLFRAAGNSDAEPDEPIATGDDRILDLNTSADQIDATGPDDVEIVDFTRINSDNVHYRFFDAQGSQDIANFREVGILSVRGNNVGDVLSNSVNYASNETALFRADTNVTIVGLADVPEFVIG